MKAIVMRVVHGNSAMKAVAMTAAVATGAKPAPGSPDGHH
jgi:hypothetical protein